MQTTMILPGDINLMGLPDPAVPFSRVAGQRYKLTLKVDDSASTPHYQAAFVAPREWQTLRFEATNFAASYRGRAIVVPIVRFVDVQYIGLLISDKQSGPFKIELKDVTFARYAAVRGQ